ncbi:MAG TPA: TadE/TadG family type IV pilus assembly protein [Candidatus Baltobacteraceae bacterium]|jgi:Flp pilus assembly protein TadG|nr:TadE/TadG family type IV pilus assembly protein [Candidatus Baltobacteraceae bacterium]
MKRFLTAQAGTSLIEFALVAPVFLFMLVGIIEVGRYTYFGIVAAHAARAGVQYGSQNLVTAASPPGGAIENAALNDAGNLSGWKATHAIICTNAGAQITCPISASGVIGPNLVYYVQVKVTGSVSSLLQYPGIPPQSSFTATATMRVANE